MPPPRKQQDDLFALDSVTDEQLVPPVTQEIGYPTVFVIDNIPIIPEAKFEKLKSVINKLLSKLHVVELTIPQDEKKQTKGFCFVEVEKPEDVDKAVKTVNNFKLDNNHTLLVNKFDDLDKFLNTPEEFAEPKKLDFVEQENLRSWLMNDSASDQYGLRYLDQLEVAWNNGDADDEQNHVIKRPNWTETYFAWSPYGTYMATMHKNEVSLWGGDSWKKLVRFPHKGVQLIDFSPNEGYIVTANPALRNNDNPDDPQCIIVWDVKTGDKKRGFMSGSKATGWPVFKWSQDDKYFARLTENAIQVYETPGMGLINKQSVKLRDVRDFSWSPSDNIISYFIPEDGSKPASIVLMEIPTRKEIRQQSLFSVSDCRMHWQKSGDYLCVKIDRWTKSKKSTYTTFQLFRVRTKNVPTESLDIKGTVVAFAWEPTGDRFAIIHGEGTRPNVSLYTMTPQVRLLKTFEKRPANSLFWSPQGRFLVLAGFGNGALEFIDTEEMESMGTDEHLMITGVEWDPTGRFVTTVVSGWKHQAETGYHMYTFSGKPLKNELKDRFYQFLWRPRPKFLLSRKQIKDIESNLKRYKEEFLKEDEEKRKEEKEKTMKKRTEMRTQFLKFMEGIKADYEKMSGEREKLCQFVHRPYNPHDVYEREETIEEVESTKVMEVHD